MSHPSLVLAALVALSIASPAAAVSIMPFEEVEPGMKGTGRTVFSGTRIETFEVEVLGKLPNVGPDQNLILARLSGGPLAETGVLAGMSGSPVSIGGKLVGAVAYSWGFSKAPIAGITPIEEMLAITDMGAAAASRTGTVPVGAGELARLEQPDRVASFFGDLWRDAFAARGVMPTTVPLSVAGFGPRGLSRVSAELDRLGFLPLHAGIAPAKATEAPQLELEPGSAMGLKLVDGDVEMTATGTVTWVDEDRLLGFGHALFGLGSVDLPLTGARVEALLPSLQQSSRIATPLGEVGALRQDRQAGVMGRLGARPRMIPVRLQFNGGSSDKDSFAFDIADDPLLSPLLLYVSLNGILSSKERAFGNATVRLREGSVIKMIGSQDVTLDNLYAGPTAFDIGTGLPAYILYLLMNNTWAQPQIAGVNLLLDYEVTPRTAQVRRVSLDRYRIAPGDTVEVAVMLSPYRGAEKVVRREIVVPAETPPGKLTISVGGALAISQSMGYDEPALPRDLDQLIWLINQLRRNDRVYIVASHDEGGMTVGAARLPNLPPSAATLLSRPRRSGDVTYVSERAIVEDVVLTDYAVEGSARIQLDLEVR